MLRTVSIIVARQLHAIFVARPIAAFRPSPPPLDPAERASPRSYYLSNFFFLFFFSAASADFSAFFTRATKRRKNPIPFCGGRISGRSRYRFAAQQTLLLLLSTSLDEKIFDFSSLFFSFLFPRIRFPNGGKILKILNDLSSRLAIEKTDRV